MGSGINFNPDTFFNVDQPRVGLVVVYGEASALLKLMPHVDDSGAWVQARFHRGPLAGRPVIVAKIGQGKVHAAAAAQVLIDRFGVDLLLSCGTAGAISPQRGAGDVVLASRVIPHDGGWHTEAGFVHLGVYNSALPDGRHYRRDWPADPTLLTAARHAIDATTWPETAPMVVTGPLVSGDQVIASAAKKQWLHQSFGAEAVDMEAAAVAQTAALNGCRWLAIRAISDSADSTLDIDVTRLITYDEAPPALTDKMQDAAKTVVRLALNPKQADALRKLRRGLKLAAGHAALAAAAVVNRLQ